MSEISLIMTKQGHSIDGALKKKAYSFLEKLVEDDTAAALHIEPIKHSADSRVRTGRVDLQYRAVLFRLQDGDNIIYILHGIWNHDEAIEIAKKSTLKVNPVNGLPEIRETEPAQYQPAVTPVAGSTTHDAPEIHASRADLTEELGLPVEIATQVLGARSLEELESLAVGGPEWQNLAILGLAAGMGTAEVKAELGLEKYAPSAGQTDTDEQLLESLRQPAAAVEFAHIAGMEELRRVIEDGNFANWRVFLHPEQRRYVQVAAKGPYRLSGGAGTGKTVVLLHRAKRLAAASNKPQPRILMTTFTVNLAEAMDRDLRRLDPSLPRTQKLGESGIHVRGIDSIARRILVDGDPEIVEAAQQKVLGGGGRDIAKRSGVNAWQEAIDTAGAELPQHLRSVRFFQDEYSLVILPGEITSAEEYARVRRPGRGVRLNRAARATVWKVIETYRLTARMDGTLDFSEIAAVAAKYLQLQTATGQEPLYDHVLVDEGQDMSPQHWMLVRALVKPGENDIFISEDLHQRIYGNKLVLSRYGIQIRGRSRRLKLNYRTTAQNLRFAMATLAGGEYTGEGETEAETEQLDISGYRSARSGPDPVVRHYPDRNAELDAAAETLQKWCAQVPELETIAILVRDSRQRDLVVNELGERGITVRSVDRSQYKTGMPVVMTMHRAKGMEFRKVLLLGVSREFIPRSLNEYKFSDQDYDDALLRERSLLYVAASRARDELAVSWNGDASELLPTSGEQKRNTNNE